MYDNVKQQNHFISHEIKVNMFILMNEKIHLKTIIIFVYLQFNCKLSQIILFGGMEH